MGLAADSSASIFKRIQQDDRLALNTLFAQYYQKLCTFAYTFVKNSEEAEEIVADVFVTIWKNRHTLTIQTNLKAYLYTSVKNACLAFIKKRYPVLQNIEEVLLDTALFDVNTPLQALELNEFDEYLHREIDKLPARCKQIFLMSRMEQLSYREIGEVLGIVEKTVENQLVKALSILRKSWLRHDYKPSASHQRKPDLTQA
jgi:RNA polymerase sigma-70 factor, ECF subfamily